MHKSIFQAAVCLLSAVLFAGCATVKTGAGKIESTQAVFQNWPTNCDPQAAGEKVAQNFLRRSVTVDKNGFIVYREVCTAFGALRFADATGDRELEQKLIDRYAVLLTPEGKKMISPERHVDFHVFGVLPLEIYLLNGDTNYLALGLGKADEQWENPLPNGLARESRWWVDDAFMIGSLQIQAYRATKGPRYADRVATELAAYLDRLQQPNGLFYHGPEIPHFWGRGNGWFAVGLAEVLSSLPPDHPKYARLMDGYRKMMAGLRRYQSPSGMWRQLIDNDQAWPESSCTAMFTYAMIVGVQHGWLDAKEYGDCARRGWTGLCGYIDENGNVREVCVGTGQRDDTNYYLNRPRAVGDLHGQAPVLWCAWALMQK
ncbi:MAG: glycoside hydrolase family 88 protein [Verrucomicrobiota bacterium]|jgi:rhamnogalacturonyl hydrolase YesR